MRRASLFPPEMFRKPKYWFGALLGYMALLLGTGFVLQYGFHVLPCEMCWWQRYAHMGVAAFAAAGLLIPHKRAQQLCAGGLVGAALFGLGVALWQYAAQHGWLPFPAQCTSEGVALSGAANMLESLKHIQIVPCDRENFTIFGISLAGWNIPAMVVTIYVALRGALKI